MGRFFGLEGATKSFYLIDRPKGPLRDYRWSYFVPEGTWFLWRRCSDGFGMEKQYFEWVQGCLMGVTEQDLNKAR